MKKDVFNESNVTFNCSMELMGNLDLTNVPISKEMRILENGYHTNIGLNKPLEFICNDCGKDKTKDECNC